MKRWAETVLNRPLICHSEARSDEESDRNGQKFPECMWMTNRQVVSGIFVTVESASPFV